MESTFQAQLPELTHGHHSCLLFSSPQSQLNVTVPFLALGLERDERCVYVGDRPSVERLREALKSAGINVGTEERKNRLILSSDRAYLDAGKFNTDKMLSFLQQTYDATLSEGFTALRAAGDVSWEVGEGRDFKDVVFYESLLDIFFLGKRMVGMCQYPKDRCPPGVLEGILNTHRVAAVDENVCANFHYVPAELLVEKNVEVRESKRLEWMTSQLLRARNAEAEILRLNADLERRVQERTAKLQQAFQDMESFSYSVSHDLRAPLRAIGGFSRILLDDFSGQLDGKAQGFVHRINQGVQRMAELIDDLLRFSRVSTTEISHSKIDMTALAKQVAEETGAKGIVIPALPAAEGDPGLIRQVWANLLGNAVKFTKDRPQPEIVVGSYGTDDDQIAYFVRDNGAGFDMAHAAKMFEVFQRFHRQDEFEGTGVGLAIVRQIVRKHGGRLWAEGAPGKGATFTFTLQGLREPAASRGPRA